MAGKGRPLFFFAVFLFGLGASRVKCLARQVSESSFKTGCAISEARLGHLNDDLVCHIQFYFGLGKQHVKLACKSRSLSTTQRFANMKFSIARAL
jgi:hypothetical protein